MEGEHEMTRRYTAADFANARFAEHPDGRTARVDPRCKTLSRWSSGGAFLKHDADLANAGWVPVPTKPQITETEYSDYVDDLGLGELTLEEILADLGIEIIPDPEPTNTDRLEEILEEVWTPIESARTFAEWLDSKGITAPNVKGN